jgi:flavodoxin I
MKTIVAYDSYFGNTEKIAQAIGDALAETGEVEILRVGDVKPEQVAGLDLLVVGSATRQFSASPGTMSMVKNLPAGALDSVQVAAFDTRIPEDEIQKNKILKFFVGIFGYAAEPIARQLQKKGGKLAAPAAGFYVEGTEGPLSPGELERAAAWAKQLTAG